MNTQTNSRPTNTAKMQEPRTDHNQDPWDISDVWADEVALTGDESAEVHAYFTHNWNGDVYNTILVGLRVKDGDDIVYYNETGAIDVMGFDAVMRLEVAYSDKVNGA